MEYPLIDLVTVTGWRSKAFAICEKLIVNQTYPKDKINWVVVNDDNGETQCTLNQVKINAPLIWKPGYNTQRTNWMAALPVIQESKAEYVFPIEDDDYLAPTYLESYVHLLQMFSIVGEGNSGYYNCTSKSYKEMQNYEHCSLAATGFRKEILPIFLEALHSGEKFFDITFWELCKKYKKTSMVFVNKHLSIGMKNLPGRPGIGSGHNPIGYTSDPAGSKLLEWVGQDMKYYTEFLGKKI